MPGNGADRCTPVATGGCKSAITVGVWPFASAWLAQRAHVPDKTAPTNFKRALVLGQFAQPSPPYSHHRGARNMNPLPHVCFTQVWIWTLVI